MVRPGFLTLADFEGIREGLLFCSVIFIETRILRFYTFVGSLTLKSAPGILTLVAETSSLRPVQHDGDDLHRHSLR